jgi:hypothetical protein
MLRRLSIPLYIQVGAASRRCQQILKVADTGEPVLLPFRMSCFVISNLVVTAGMLTPGLSVSCKHWLLRTPMLNIC